MPTLNVERVDIDEGDGGATEVAFRVWILEPSDEEITFEFDLKHGTTAPGDFWGAVIPGPHVGTIEAGDTFVDIPFYLAADSSNDEVDEAFWLELFNPVNAQLPDDATSLTALGVINDDDGTGSNLSMFVSSPRVIERDNGTRVAAFDIHLSRESGSTLTFDYTTLDGSAKAGSDYVAKTGSVQFGPGDLTKTVFVDITGDKNVELSEFFSLSVTPTSDIKNGVLGSTGVANILDDDAEKGNLPTLSVERAGLEESDHSGGGPVMVFRVTLSEASDEEIAVTYSGRHGSTSSNDIRVGSILPSSEELIIEAGKTTGFIKIPIQGGIDDDEVDEAFWLELFNPKGAILAGGGPKISAIGIIGDDDGTGSDLALFVSSPVLREGAGGKQSAVFEVHLSHGYDEDLTFDFETSNGSARAGQDYAAKSGTITFLAGQTVASVEVEVLGDDLLENNETFSLKVSPTSEIKNSGTSHTGVATIANDDDKHERIEGNDGKDALFGRDGNDRLYGFGGDDRLDGGEGDDLIFGGADDDKITGGRGKDKMHGEGGSDTFIFRAVAESGPKSSQRDTIADFSRQGGDVLDLRGIDANAEKSGNQSFNFIGNDDFPDEPGRLRYERDGNDVIVYGNTDDDRKNEFSLLLEDISSIARADILL